jgi:hypothetical protein
MRFTDPSLYLLKNRGDEDGQILVFPPRFALAPLRIRSGRQHDISVRVLDTVRPEEARWHLQFAMQRAASFQCLDGFTDHAARRGTWHDFKVRQTKLLHRFVRDIDTLVHDGRVAVEVDGMRVRSTLRKRA